MDVSIKLLGGFLALSALLSVVPGPAVIRSTSRAITRGRAPAMRIVMGNALGGLVLLAFVIAGLGVVVATVAPVFTAMKIAGAGYLLYLGVRSILAARSTSPSELLTHDSNTHGTFRVLGEGFLVGVSNPKSIVFLVAVLPQFVDPSLGSVTVQMIVIGLSGSIAQFLIETGWVLAGTGLRSWFLGRPRRVKILQASSGLAMIGLSAKLAVERSAN
jgi:threonine/homoserine/homoserine lactone efflux protein